MINRSILILLLALILIPPIFADGWKASVGYHKYGWRQEFTQRLSKDFGKWTASIDARQLTDGNHLNLQLGNPKWGIEFKSGKFISDNLSKYSLTWLDHPKSPYMYKTPCEDLLHAFMKTSWSSGQIRIDYFRKDMIHEWELEASAEW